MRNSLWYTISSYTRLVSAAEIHTSCDVVLKAQVNRIPAIERQDGHKLPRLFPLNFAPCRDLLDIEGVKRSNDTIRLFTDEVPHIFRSRDLTTAGPSLTRNSAKLACLPSLN